MSCCSRMRSFRRKELFFRVVAECDLLEGAFFLSFFLFLFYDILGIEVCSSLFRV